jgi:ABC-type multidrug transport system fused ATPase/permease subunit
MTAGVADAMVRRARYLGAIRAAGEFTVGLATAATLLFGAWQAASGDTSPGTLAATLTILAMFSGPIRDFERIVEYRSAPAWHREGSTASSAFRRCPAFQAEGRPIIFNRIADLAINGAAARIRGTVRPKRSSSPTAWHRQVDVHPHWRSCTANKVGSLSAAPIFAKSARRLREPIGVVSPELPLTASIRRNVLYRKPTPTPTMSSARARTGP